MLMLFFFAFLSAYSPAPPRVKRNQGERKKINQFSYTAAKKSAWLKTHRDASYLTLVQDFKDTDESR